jgi:hypothetical protein
VPTTSRPASPAPTGSRRTARWQVATRDGIAVAPRAGRILAGASVDGIAVDGDGDATWAIVAGTELHRIDSDGDELVARLDDGRASVVHVHGGTVWLGGEEARVWRLGPTRELAAVTSFDRAPTHERWSTPWGGPPEIFSMASHGDDLYVSLHVGGILRTDDAGRSWVATIDLDTDVHQVATAADGTVWAATGMAGLAESRDRGATWTFHTEGLDATYALAVAVTDDGPIVSVSSGHASTDGALHRFDGERFHRLGVGLPETFDGAVGPRRLAARSAAVAAVLPGGVLVTSDDAGRTWTASPERLPGTHEVLLEQ